MFRRLYVYLSLCSSSLMAVFSLYTPHWLKQKMSLYIGQDGERDWEWKRICSKSIFDIRFEEMNHVNELAPYKDNFLSIQMASCNAALHCIALHRKRHTHTYTYGNEFLRRSINRLLACGYHKPHFSLPLLLLIPTWNGNNASRLWRLFTLVK